MNNAPQAQYQPQNYGVNNAPQAQYQPQNYGANNAPQPQYPPQNYGVNNAPQAQYQPQNYGANTPPQNPCPPQNGDENKPPKKPNRLPLIIGIAVAVVAIIAVVLVLVLGGGDKKSGGDECQHKYGEWVCEDESLICEDRTYRRVCTKCNKETTKKGSYDDHDFEEFGSGSICGHANGGGSECSICGLIEFNDTDFSGISSDDPDVWYRFDENRHWLECSVCTGKTEKEAHEFNSSGVCIYCYYSEGAALNPLAGTYYITLWVPEAENAIQKTQGMINRFMADNPGIIINAEIRDINESETVEYILADVDTVPDIYCFTQEDLCLLVQAGAIAAPESDIEEYIIANNNAGAVAAASVNGNVYAYPMSLDNGYYLYYDKSVISDPDSLEAIINDCNMAYYSGYRNHLLRFGVENGWYTTSFFFATGCESSWIRDIDGQFTGLTDTFNSEAGLIALRGMANMTQSICFDPNADYFEGAAAVVTGIWNARIAEEYYGANLGVADLPSFTVDGESYHLGSFCAGRLMGVKPQADPKRGAVLQLLATYLTNEECQMERYNNYGWIPSNLNAQYSYEIQSDPHALALLEQGNYAVPQRHIHGNWWDIMAKVGADSRNAKSEYDLLNILENYDAEINAIFNMTEEERTKWSIIGCIEGYTWDYDFPMHQVGDGVWESNVLYLTYGAEYKFRRGKSWDLHIGEDGWVCTPYTSPPNILVYVPDGYYTVRLEWDGVSEQANIIYIPA